MIKFEVVPETIKEVMRCRKLSLKKLQFETKLPMKMLEEVLSGNMAMPHALMERLDTLYGVTEDFWQNLQNAEVKDYNIQVGKDGRVF